MRIGSLRVFGVGVALVAAQAANAATLKAPAGHIDPLLSLSLLASAQSRAIVCERSSVYTDGDVGSASGNCALPGNGDAGFEPGSPPFGPGAAAHAAWLSALPATIFGFTTYIGFMFALTNDVRVVGPVSPS